MKFPVEERRHINFLMESTTPFFKARKMLATCNLSGFLKLLLYFGHCIATIGVFIEIWLLLTLNDDTLMDPLTSRITRILVDKGTFYTLISLNIVHLTWKWFSMMHDPDYQLSSIMYPCLWTVLKWCGVSPPIGAIKGSHRTRIMKCHHAIMCLVVTRAALLLTAAAAVCVVSGLCSSADVRISAASLFQLLLPRRILIPQLDAVCWPGIMWYGIRHVGNVLCV